MPIDSGILHAYSIEGDGSGLILTIGEIAGALYNDEVLDWVHLDARNTNARDWLIKEVSYLDHIIIDALLAEETRPRILEFEHGVLMILRAMNLNDDADPADMVSIRLWVDERRIISLQHRDSKTIGDIADHLKSGSGPKNAGDFIVMLTGHLFERMEPVLSEMNERTDAIEEIVMENPNPSQREEIISIRKQAIIIRRYILPQRDVLSHLRVSGLPWLTELHRRRIQETLDVVIRYTEDLDIIRERAQIVKDELTSALSDKINLNLFVLSLVGSVFMPLSFLTGLLGINVAGIPGAENPYAFGVVIVILLCVAAIEIFIFKLLKWF